MAGVGIGPCIAGSLVGKHRQGSHPLLAHSPAGHPCPDLARNRVGSAVMAVQVQTGTDGVAVAGIAGGLRLGPGKGSHCVRVCCPVAVAVDIVADLGITIVTRQGPADDLPHVCVHDHVGRHVHVLCPVFDVSVNIHRVVMAVIAGIFSDPLRADQTVVAIGHHGQVFRANAVTAAKAAPASLDCRTIRKGIVRYLRCIIVRPRGSSPVAGEALHAVVSIRPIHRLVRHTAIGTAVAIGEVTSFVDAVGPALFEKHILHPVYVTRQIFDVAVAGYCCTVAFFAVEGVAGAVGMFTMSAGKSCACAGIIMA